MFSLGSEGDCQRRPLLPAPLARLERDLRERCLESLLDAGRHEGLALDLATRGVDSSPAIDRGDGVRRFAQRGESFGDRLVNALEDALRHHRGSEIVVVGGDTPDLGPGHLRRAIELTRRDPDCVVLGPSLDGGFYLLAAAQPVEDALRQVRWCGAHARRDLISALERAGRRVHLLEPLADLDRPRDLEALLRRDWSGTWLALLADRIRAARRELTRPTRELETGRLTTRRLIGPALRAPPA